MAFDDAPSVWLGAGYSLASNQVRFNTATAGSDVALPQVTDAEANATTGDIRKVMFGISEAFYQAWLAKVQADRPARMSIGKSSNVNPATGIVTHTYSFVFHNQISAQDVANEPA